MLLLIQISGQDTEEMWYMSRWRTKKSHSRKIMIVTSMITGHSFKDRKNKWEEEDSKQTEENLKRKKKKKFEKREDSE